MPVLAVGQLMARDATPIRKYLRDCRDTTSLDDLRTAAISYYSTTHVLMASYLHYPPVGARDFDGAIRIGAFGYPKDWGQKYLNERLYLSDPLARRASGFTRPHFWSEIKNLPDLTEAELAYMEQAAKVKMGEGIGIPVFGPFNRNGYCALGFGYGNPAPDGDEILELQVACQIGHLAYCEMLQRNLPPETTLSAREKEILHWIARGRTNAQIADGLEISRNTVETYIRRCFEKLGVNDRVSAALRGMALGRVD